MSLYWQAFRRFADFHGRSTRPEYWWFAGINALVFSLLVALEYAIGWSRPGQDFGLLSGLYAAIALLPWIAVSVRRLRDRGSSGWWLLLGGVPLLGSLVLFLMFVTRGTRGWNRFGADPQGGLPDVASSGRVPLATRYGPFAVCPWCGHANPLGGSACKHCHKPYEDGSTDSAFDDTE